jgi:predicted nucleotidyltransferase
VTAFAASAILLAMSDETLQERLRSVLAAAPIRLAVLFGSRAKGKARPDSDVDIGVLPVDPAWSFSEEASLASALSAVARAEIDLVRLDRDEPLLGREIARSGVCLFEVRPGEHVAWRARAMSAFIDFEGSIAPYRQRFLDRLAVRRT